MDHRPVDHPGGAVPPGACPGFAPHPAPARLAGGARPRLDGAGRPRAELRVVRGAVVLHRAAHPAAARGPRPGRPAHRVRRGRPTAAGRRVRPESGPGPARRRRRGYRRLRPYAASGGTPAGTGRTPARADRRPAAHPARTGRHRAARGNPRRAPAALHGDPRHPGPGPVQPTDAAPGGRPHLERRSGRRPPPCAYGHRHRGTQPRRGPPLRPRPGPGRPGRGRRPGGGPGSAGGPRERPGGGRAHRPLPCGGHPGRPAAGPGAVRPAAHRPGSPGQCAGALRGHRRRADPDPPRRPGGPRHRRQRPRLHRGARARPQPRHRARPRAPRHPGPRAPARRNAHHRIGPGRGDRPLGRDPARAGPLTAQEDPA